MSVLTDEQIVEKWNAFGFARVTPGEHGAARVVAFARAIESAVLEAQAVASLPTEMGDMRDEDDWYYLKRDALQWAKALRKVLPLLLMDCNTLDDLEAFLRRVAAEPAPSTASPPEHSGTDEK